MRWLRHSGVGGRDRAVSGSLGVLIMFLLTVAIIAIIGAFVLLPG